MKKTISVLLSIILLSIPSFANANKEQNWYFSSKNRNERPGLPSLDQKLGIGIGKDEKVLYLTFDAGYENGNVEKIVDILKENEVSGAFFVLKHFVEDNPALCEKICAGGNLICNHTFSHRNIATLSEEEIKEELSQMETLYENVTGRKMSRFFRPPEGAYTEDALKTVSEMGYKTIFWSLAWADWDNNDQKSPEYAMSKLLPRVHPGAVILLHPTSKTNAMILGDFIQKMKDEGYRFGSLEEL